MCAIISRFYGRNRLGFLASVKSAHKRARYMCGISLKFSIFFSKSVSLINSSLKILRARQDRTQLQFSFLNFFIMDVLIRCASVRSFSWNRRKWHSMSLKLIFIFEFSQKISGKVVKTSHYEMPESNRWRKWKNDVILASDKNLNYI